MPTYNPLVPSGTVPLNQDYQNVQNNFNQANISFGTDHYAFSDSTSNNGYHKAIHIVNSAGNPSTVAGTGILFTKQTNDGTANQPSLYWETTGGILATMTRNFTPKGLTNNYLPADGGGAVGTKFSAGYTFIPGGLIYQYGFYNNGTSGITTSRQDLKFPFKFTNASSVIVTITPICKAGGTSVEDTFSYETGTVSTTQFTWNATTSTTAYQGINWVAIGV